MADEITPPLTPEEVNDLLEPYDSDAEERAVMALSRLNCNLRAASLAMDRAGDAFVALRKAWFAIAREQRTYTPKKKR